MTWIWMAIIKNDNNNKHHNFLFLIFGTFIVLIVNAKLIIVNAMIVSLTYC